MIELWNIAEECWSQNPWNRPSFPAVLDKLNAFASPVPSRVGTLDGYLRLIADGDLASPQEITTMLNKALEATGYSDCVKGLRNFGIDPQSFIDGLDKASFRLFLPLTALIYGWVNLRRSIAFHQNPISTSDASEH